ncbi:MAG UNVERIFIED_CONTAM: hypothetical protein LVQ98_00755 [Rickettsiaceae bacterium]|jgi:hypothetical protein
MKKTTNRNIKDKWKEAEERDRFCNCMIIILSFLIIVLLSIFIAYRWI